MKRFLLGLMMIGCGGQMEEDPTTPPTIYCAVEANGVDRLVACESLTSYVVQVGTYPVYAYASCQNEVGVIGQTCYVNGKSGKIVVSE